MYEQPQRTKHTTRQRKISSEPYHGHRQPQPYTTYISFQTETDTYALTAQNGEEKKKTVLMQKKK